MNETRETTQPIQPQNPPAPDGPAEPKLIKNVWKYNAEKEVARIAALIAEGFTFVAMDTEFPGIVYNYVVDNRTPEMGYRILKMNVDNLKLIQVGVSLARENGEKPEGCDTWQFNLDFDVAKEKSHPESINLLREAGIDFDELVEHGIDPMVFSDLLMGSGLVVNPDVSWITFHGAYDFSYLLKLLINDALPQTSQQFMNYLKHIFPNVYDIKTMINEMEQWRNYSLSKLGFDLSIARTGHQHQAGSDALLTLELFFELLATKFRDGVPPRLANKIFGLSNEGSVAFGSHGNNGDAVAQNFALNYGSYYQHYGGYPYYPEPVYNTMDFFFQPQTPHLANPYFQNVRPGANSHMGNGQPNWQ